MGLQNRFEGHLFSCFAVDTVRRSGVNAQLTVFSPDTDVLVLAIANYDLLPKNTTVSMASADLCIQAFWDVLGPDKAKALPALHAFSGSDTTGKFPKWENQPGSKLSLELMMISSVP